MKRILSLLSCLAVVLFCNSAFAGGADLFLAKCMGCHSQKGGAPFISPTDKSASVWEKYFKRHRHPVDLSKTITESELKQIIETLKEHAADSDQPASAIIPK